MKSAIEEKLEKLSTLEVGDMLMEVRVKSLVAYC
jgi:hypothetical protein